MRRLPGRQRRFQRQRPEGVLLRHQLRYGIEYTARGFHSNLIEMMINQQCTFHLPSRGQLAPYPLPETLYPVSLVWQMTTPRRSGTNVRRLVPWDPQPATCKGGPPQPSPLSSLVSLLSQPRLPRHQPLPLPPSPGSRSRGPRHHPWRRNRIQESRIRRPLPLSPPHSTPTRQV